MDPAFQLVCLCFAVVACFVIFDAFDRWSGRQLLDRIMNTLLAQPAAATEIPLSPVQSDYGVDTTPAEICFRYPEGKTRSIAWDELECVEIATEDQGPTEPDVFWILRSPRTTCRIPVGASGDEQLLQRLQSLPNFQHDVFNLAMSTADDESFVVWTRS